MFKAALFAVAAVLAALSLTVPAHAISPNQIVWLCKADSQDSFGWQMARAGDQNNDGFNDIWILHRPHVGFTTDVDPTLYLYHGGQPMDTVPDFAIHQPIKSIWPVGDMNQDGYEDILALYSIRDLTSPTEARQWYGLHYGGPLLQVQPNKRFAPLDTATYNDGLVHTIAGGFDLGTDGKPDLVISEPGSNGGITGIFSSYPQFDTVPDMVFGRGDPPGYYSFGLTTTFIRNGTGHPWLAIGIRGSQYPEGNRGSSFFYETGPLFDTLPDLTLNPPAQAQQDAWGSLIRDVGDVNGDGYEDIVINSYLTQYSNGYLYLGGKDNGSTLDTTWDVEIKPSFNDLEGIGDINNDGHPDLAAAEVPFAGRVWLYYGGPGMDGFVDMEVHPRYPNFIALFGRRVAALGDVNGDGIDDFAASAVIDSANIDPGIVFIFAGYNGIPTDVEDDYQPGLPAKFELLQNYPNPFNGETTIEFSLPQNQHVSVEVVNALGQEVAMLLDKSLQAGVHRLRWDARDSEGSDLPSGIYFCRVKAGEQEQSLKVVLVK